MSVFADSLLLESVKQHLHLSYLDVDGTIAGYTETPTAAEIEARREIRSICDMQGGVIFNTMRTPELCMSEESLRASQLAGFGRGEPRCFLNEGEKREYRSLNTILKFMHNLDPHAVSNVGTGIWVRQNSGAYLPDLNYAPSTSWKRSVAALLEVVDFDYAIRNKFWIPEDVADPESRFELRFETESEMEGIAWKKLVRQRLFMLRGKRDFLAGVANSLELIDESNPAKGRYQLYVVPKRHTKEAAANYMLRQVCTLLRRGSEHFTLFSAGDTMTDLKAGLLSGYLATSYFVLAGGSRITDYLVGEKRGLRFAGQSLDSIVRRLKPTAIKGWYTFSIPGMPTRVIIIADEAVSGDKTDAESVLAVLKQILSYQARMAKSA